MIYLLYRCILHVVAIFVCFLYALLSIYLSISLHGALLVRLGRVGSQLLLNDILRDA